MLNTMPKKPRYPQQELADRLRAAMEEADVSLASMARACGVTIQAVHDWRETGRVGKQHLVTICRMTGKPFEYFLVGLGRAAAVLLAVALLAPPPAPVEAATQATFNINISVLHIVRLWLARLLRAMTISVELRTTG